MEKPPTPRSTNISGSTLPPTNPNDIKSALECQIDIVLRLEEERLQLLKENKVQREKIRELTLKTDTLVPRKFTHPIEKDTQTEFIGHSEVEIQTDEVSEPARPTIMTEKGHQKSVIEEASEYINKYSELVYSQSTLNVSQVPQSNKKKSLADKMPVKSLKFVQEKENSRVLSNEDEKNISFVAKNLRNEKDVLAQEVVNLNREITKLRTENRIASENFKRVEKERTELKKVLEVKNENIDKLKKENGEMSLIINADQYRTVRTLEAELKKVLSHNKELLEELQNVRKEKIQAEENMNEFKTQLDALGDEIERRLAEEQKATKVLESNKILEEQIKEMDHRMKLKDEELELKKKSLEEMMRENENLNKDVEYFKDVAKTCKSHAEKAIADCEMYRNMLEPKRRLNEYLNH